MAEPTRVELRRCNALAGRKSSGRTRLSCAWQRSIGIAIGLLSLATPISVQLLINSVASALPAALVTLSGLLFALLFVVALLSTLRVYVMTLFERRLFARVDRRNHHPGRSRPRSLLRRCRAAPICSTASSISPSSRKSVPSLLIGGFTIMLQSAVGLVVTSFYHPFFLAFNVTLLLCAARRMAALVARLDDQRGGAPTPSMIPRAGSKASAAPTASTSQAAMSASRWTRSERRWPNYIAKHRQSSATAFAQTFTFFMLYAFGLGSAARAWRQPHPGR